MRISLYAGNKMHGGRYCHLHDGVILLLRPESYGFFLSCVNCRLCYLNLAGITKFKCERKNEKNSGRGSKMTPSCKWPIKRDFTFLVGETRAEKGVCSLRLTFLGL